jgi:DNA-binding NarL/FixJ family response regulator
MDLSMPGIGGLEAIRRMAAMGLETRVLVLTAHAEEEFLLPVLEAGGSGYVTKSGPAGGAAVADFQVQVPGDYVLVDHSRSRLARGAFGVLRVAGEKNVAIFEPVSSSMKAALPSGH